jgi:hypothetical protein
MDKIEHAIMERRREADQLGARLAVIDEEIATLMRAAALVGLNVDAAKPNGADGQPETVHKRGRQLGAISMQWRDALRILYHRGGGHSYRDIQAAAEEVRLIIGIPSLRERVRRFIAQGMMSVDSDGKFLVTAPAAIRFDFTKQDEAPG